MSVRSPIAFCAILPALLSAAGCDKGVAYRFVSGEPPRAVEPQDLEPGRPFRLHVKIERRTFVYVYEERPDGSIVALLPMPAIKNGSDDFTADEMIELPAAGAGAAPARLTLLVADVPVPGLRELLAAGRPDAGRVRALVDELRRAMPSNQVKHVEIAEGWTRVFIRQLGVDEVLIETIRVGR
jgi:hypothetical protein